ncbi:PEBP-like protein [Trichodelitschia bisporula]|uniref:Large ribosomal subunit protein mL38 n=1 Tax=Trichodelitschia bisporula TaxID=703511 RepID=A0A6G1HPC3_9PEZI|nr:PEBP-like protein [Trichodelitschia bisporula]
MAAVQRTLGAGSSLAQRPAALLVSRGFTTLPALHAVAQQQQKPRTPAELLDPNLVSTVSEEHRLIKHQKTMPIGSRRRRAALGSTANIPFEQLPYQCFQEARKVLAADREEKLVQIQTQRERIARLEAQDEAVSGGKAEKRRRLDSMRRHLEELKIWADINDPIVKKKFEDGMGDMNKPVYRFLANRKWHSYKRPLLLQRLTQMNVIPDVIPHLDPVMEVTATFGRPIVPGDFVDSRRSEHPPTLHVQPFTAGSKLVTIVVVDADVPDLERDSFGFRCHAIYANVPVSPTQTRIALREVEKRGEAGLAWLPPFAQKGSPYHRLAVVVLEQPEGVTLDVEALRGVQRDGFILRSFADKQKLTAVGATMFRAVWDEGTAGVMARAGIEGADVELKRKRVAPLPYKKKDGARYR